MSKEVIRGDKDETTLRPAEFYVENKVDLKLGSPATSVDTVAKSVAFADGSTLDYDELVIATGLTPRRIAGLPELSGVHVLRSIEEALALRADLAPGKRALIVGGAGFIGCELAASMKSHGVDVVLLEPQPTPLASVLGPPTVGALVERLHRNEGIDVRVGTGLTSLSGDGAVAAATLSDGSEIPVDVVAIGVGSVPVTEWLDGSGDRTRQRSALRRRRPHQHRTRLGGRRRRVLADRRSTQACRTLDQCWGPGQDPGGSDHRNG